MSSSHPIEVSQIVAIKPHSNADKLEIVTVKGWDVIVQKGQFEVGQKVVHFIPNSILARETSDRFNVTKYLAGKDQNRVKAAKLRGLPSFGFVVAPDDPTWEIGKDVAEYYGVTKWEPPVVEVPQDCLSTNQNPETANIQRYTDIENGLNYPDIFSIGDEVIATEKIHGCNVRLVYKNGKWYAASKNLFRKYPGSEDGTCISPDPEVCKRSRYWFPYTIAGMTDLMQSLVIVPNDEIVVYGEVYGKGIQFLDYGLPCWGFAAFDISINGKYMGFDDLIRAAVKYNIPTPPIVKRLIWTNETLHVVKALADQISSSSLLHMHNNHVAGPGEGIVVRTVNEQFHPKHGRKIMKVIGAEYLTGKASDHDTTDN